MTIKFEKCDLLVAQTEAKAFVNRLSDGLADRLTDDTNNGRLSLEDAKLELAETIIRTALANYNQGGDARGVSEDWEGPVDVEEVIRSIRSTQEPNPNELYQAEDAENLAGLNAEEMGFYLNHKRITYERLVDKVNATIGDTANALVSAGVLSVSYSAGKKAIIELAKTKSARRAVVAGVKAIGVTNSLVVVGFILAAIILYFLLTAEKSFYGVVLNLSETNLNCSEEDRYMHAGTLVSFPLDKEDGVNANTVNIRGSALAFDDDGNDVLAYYAGTYFAEKKFGLFGAEGMFSLAPENRTGPNLAILFSCPYFEDNGVNLETNIRGSQLSDYWNPLRNERKLRVRINKDGISAEATVDAARGSTPIGLTVIHKYDA
ncbi:MULTISPECIES: hypothetical protein [Pseudoalteromonas]|uniref:Uncharacterized protein n=1 Tax=Pseudoalteromonas amylolytica TaxID=1859457 RepID=A0A1S1MT43_9GAMM|nr:MULTISPECIES: hypothetical protein [Pseudoalteromonas]OHU85151.1 hypothetical protein BFC16_20995 [Pseudoalteromonas sp. JW3]OHU89898.1 hypothetical protein BET10_13980 [Pseudoalteromonas amylolytica]